MLCPLKNPLAVALLLATTLSARLCAEDWPQWRGANRDGVCSESGLLETFPAGGLKIKWRAPVAWGWSSPVVAKGRVYVTDSELTKPKMHERLFCFDEATGKSLWTMRYEVDYPDWAFDPTQQVGPVATPIVDNGKVYAVGKLNKLFAVDAVKGELLWEKDLEKEFEAKFAAGSPSPLIEGDLLILMIGGKPDACVVALDKKSGAEVWRALDEKMTFSSPIVIRAGGTKQLILWTEESVTALDPLTGKVHWRQPLLTSNEYAISTPVFRDGQLLIGGLMFKLDADKPAAEVLWPRSKAPARRIFSHTSTALIRGDHVYSAKSTGELVCVDAKTGMQVWATEKVTSLSNGASIHLTDNGDSVLLYTDKGELIRAQLTGAGYREISRATVLEPGYPFGGRNVNWSPPAYANGHIFARNGKELVCASLVEKP